MNTYQIDMNSKLAAEFTRAEKLNLFRVHVDIILCDFNSRVKSVEYHRSSIDLDESVQFT